ncbi:MlaD family protein [Alteromonas lipolytica]|uniref:Mce/MlaD domain-containing protein n=1 Tax=Alteromonas lipolytica TaxID=1856405 RepID=A0A1E8F965_9ALTE|nr:MlaD family protein [Alteromonas lipolytica]OFI32457.1 hypothetical protein BFC17_07010 [Alteromonas lipolytica]GGF79493.1 hypothetical protein GCM10011338_34800 [Alteromonas lipolytica]
MSFAPSQSLSSRWQDTLLGMFVVVALLLAGWLVFEDLQEQHGEQIRFEAHLSASYGLSAGSPVKLKGVTVGRIDSIHLTDSGEVALNLVMQPEYRALYRMGSKLQVESALAIDSVLSGAAIAFIPGDSGQLANGAVLDADEPQSLQDLMVEWDVAALSQKVADILINLESIVANVNNKQEVLNQSMENIATLTANMAGISQQLPAVIDQMQQTMQVMQTSLQDSTENLNNNMDAFAGVASQSATLIESINGIATDIQPTVADLPETQALLNDLLLEVNGLTRQLRQHWLLRGDNPTATPGQAPENNGLFPPDESLYDPAVRAPEKGEPES